MTTGGQSAQRKLLVHCSAMSGKVTVWGQADWGRREKWWGGVGAGTDVMEGHTERQSVAHN